MSDVIKFGQLQQHLICVEKENEQLRAALEQSQAENAVLVNALEFYAEPGNVYTAGTGSYREWTSCSKVTSDKAGTHAKEALATTSGQAKALLKIVEAARVMYADGMFSVTKHDVNTLEMALTEYDALERK